MIFWEHLLEFMSWFRHERIVLCSSFSHSRFHSSGSPRQSLRVDESQQQFVVVDRRFAPVQYPPGEQVLNCALQTQTKRFPVPRIAGVPHDATDEIVRRDMRPKFLLHHIRAFAPADIQLHGRL